MRRQLMGGFVALLVAGAAVAWLPSGVYAQEAQGEAPAEVTIAAGSETIAVSGAADEAQVKEKGQKDEGERTWRRKKRFRRDWGDGEGRRGEWRRFRRHHHHHHHHYHHRYHHRHYGEGGYGYHHGPGFWRGMRGRPGPMGRPGPGMGMNFLMGRGPWSMEEIPEELKTPELEASLERAREAEEAARGAAMELAKTGAALMEARLQVMEQWLEAARAAGKITDEQYGRMRERHQRLRDALEQGPEAWRERWRERRSGERD